MTKFEVAHICEQGQDIIIIVVASSFGHRSNTEQNEIYSQLQDAANSAGLRGTAVLVWDSGFGSMGFLGPKQWTSYFKKMSLADVAININRSLTID